MSGKDATGIEAFAHALATKTALVLGSKLDGPFTTISYQKGLPYFWQYGPNLVYNKVTLDLVDRLALVDDDGICTFPGGGFSSLYLQILRNVEFKLSNGDQKAISKAVDSTTTKAKQTVKIYERDVAPITQEQIKMSGVYPPKKIAYVENEVKVHWGGKAGKIPAALAAFRTAYLEWKSANRTLVNLEARQTNAQGMLDNAKANTLSPSAKNGGQLVGDGSYHVPFTGFQPTNKILGSLNTDSNSLTVTWEESNLTSGQPMSSIDGAMPGLASPDAIVVSLGGGVQQALQTLSGSATKATISITYPGLTIIQPQPMSLAAKPTDGWYSNEILTEVVEKTGTTSTGFRLTGTEYSVKQLFGEGKRFARVKTFVISRDPTIEITFYDADRSDLEAKYVKGQSVRLDLAGTFSFGMSTGGLEVQAVESTRDGGNTTVVRIGPPKPQGTIPAQNQTAYILGGVLSFPPKLISSLEGAESLITALPGTVTAAKISCVNQGVFSMKFRIKWAEEQSGWSETFATGKTATFDLATLNIPDGAEVWPEVQALLGNSIQCSERVRYEADTSETADYRISGTTLDISCALI